MNLHAFRSLRRPPTTERVPQLGGPTNIDLYNQKTNLIKMYIDYIGFYKKS